MRPLASSPLGDMLVWCHRLGMQWLDLRPTEGIVRAEGNGYTLNSSLVRALGPLALFLHYKHKHDLAHLWAPTYAADTLAFGIIPTHHDLDVPELEVTPREKLFELFKLWDGSPNKEHLAKLHEEIDKSRLRSGLPNLTALVAPMIPSLSHPIFRAPNRIPWAGIIHIEEWRVFKYRLEKFLDKEDATADRPLDEKHQRYSQLRNIRIVLQELDKDPRTRWDIGGRMTSSAKDFTRRGRFFALHGMCTNHIREFNQKRFEERKHNNGPRFSNYYQLVQLYVILGVHYRQQAQDRIDKNKKPTNTLGMTWGLSPILTESKYMPCPLYPQPFPLSACINPSSNARF